MDSSRLTQHVLLTNWYVCSILPCLQRRNPCVSLRAAERQPQALASLTHEPLRPARSRQWQLWQSRRTKPLHRAAAFLRPPTEPISNAPERPHISPSYHVTSTRSLQSTQPRAKPNTNARELSDGSEALHDPPTAGNPNGTRSRTGARTGNSK